MSIEITHRCAEGIEILDLDGHLSFGQEDLDFRSALDLLLQAGEVRVALNFGGPRELDTTGLGTLLFALAELRKAGGNLAIFNVKRAHFELLPTARLETVSSYSRTNMKPSTASFPIAQSGISTSWSLSSPSICQSNVPHDARIRLDAPAVSCTSVTKPIVETGDNPMLLFH